MNTSGYDEDVRAIEVVTERQFASLSRAKARPADWEAFPIDFFEGASFYSATRPAREEP